MRCGRLPNAPVWPRESSYIAQSSPARLRNRLKSTVIRRVSPFLSPSRFAVITIIIGPVRPLRPATKLAA